MISAETLERIVSEYPDAPSIEIEGDKMIRNPDRPIYTLYRADGQYTVTGLGWGHGLLFVCTVEKGTTGITYEHETINTEEEEQIEYDCCQKTLDAWLI